MEIEWKEPKPTTDKPEFLAFPDDGFIAFRLPETMIPTDADRKGADGVMIRFKSAEGFKNFLVSAVETAALVWPEFTKLWLEGETKQ